MSVRKFHLVLKNGDRACGADRTQAAGLYRRDFIALARISSNLKYFCKKCLDLARPKKA